VTALGSWVPPLNMTIQLCLKLSNCLLHFIGNVISLETFSRMCERVRLAASAAGGERNGRGKEYA
jgi:hypothetical protein